MSAPPVEFAPRFGVQVNGVDMHADVASAVTELSVTSEPDTLDHFSLTLANPYPDMRWTHDERDADVFREGNGVVIKLGYGTALAEVFDGEITAVRASFPETGTPTLRIEGYSRLHRLRGAPRTRTFLNMTDREIAQRIASDLSLQLEADDPGVKHPYVIQFNETDFAFLLERARRVRYRVQVVGRKLRFKKGGESEPAALTLVWGRAPGDLQEPDARPLRSFTPTVNTLKPVDHVIVRGHDPKTREPIEARASGGDVDSTLGGKHKGPDVAKATFGDRGLTVVDRPVASRDEAAQLARSILTERALEFVTGTGSAVGHPELNAGRVVRLLGLGRFSGRYFVTASTHTLGPSGYLTSFTARSDSLP